MKNLMVYFIQVLPKFMECDILIIVNKREVMSMTREEMIDEVIRTNGLEDKWTIWFCELAEDSSISNGALRNAMICATTMPLIEEED